MVRGPGQTLQQRIARAAGHPGLWFALAAAALAYAAPPLSDHPDTVRDLLQARDCAETGRCVAGGPQASFGQLRGGALWPATLAALRWLGAPSEAVHALVIAADGAAVAVTAALAGAWPAALLTAALLVSTREHLVWSPALLPLIAALTAAAWRRADGDLRDRRWAALGAGLGVLADLHPVGGLFAAAALLWLPWAAPRPLRALIAAGAAALAVALLLAPEVQLANLRALGGRAPAWLALAAVATAASALLAQRRRVDCPQVQRCPARPWPALAAVATASAALAAAAATGLAPLQPRYFLAAWPELALALGAGWPMPAALAPLLAAAAAAVAGPASLGVGHPWPVVRQLAADLSGAGVGWPQHLYRLQGHGCRRLAAAVQVEVPAAPAQPSDAGTRSWQVLDLAADATPAGGGWRLGPAWRDGARTLHTWTRVTTPWLQAHRGEGCLVSDGGRTCEALRPGLLAHGTAPAAASETPWHLRTFPAAVRFAPGPRAAQVRFALDLEVSAPGRRHLRLAQLADRRCPWRIDGADATSAGMRAEVAADGQSAWLSSAAPGRGRLRVQRSWGPGCDDPSEWEFGPPCLFETEASP